MAGGGGDWGHGGGKDRDLEFFVLLLRFMKLLEIYRFLLENICLNILHVQSLAVPRQK